MKFNVLTLTLHNFVAAFSAGSSRVTGAANKVLAGLIVIDVALLGLWWALDGGDRLSHVAKKILHIGFWIWIVQAFPSLADSFVHSLIQVGQLAGGGTGGASLLMDPSQIAGYGLDATDQLAKKLNDLGITDLGQLILYVVCFYGILACYFVMAIHVFLGVLEYYLITALVGIFLPFGLLPSTKFLAEKAIGAVVAVSIKLMTLSFVVAVIQPVLSKSVQFSPDIPFNEVFALFLTVATLAFVTWKAPNLAASLMSGTPNLGAGDITSPILAAAGAAIGTAAAIKTGGTSAAATKAASGATGAAASAAGDVGGRTATSALASRAAAAPAAPPAGSGSSGSGSPAPASPASPSAGTGGTAVMPAAANRTLVMSSQQSPIGTERLPQYVPTNSTPTDSPRGAGLAPATAAQQTTPTTPAQSSSSEPNTAPLPARSPA